MPTNFAPARASARWTAPRRRCPVFTHCPPSDFHDVTTGSNGEDSSAGPGYDLVTGLGTPVANLLVPDLAFPPPTATAKLGDMSMISNMAVFSVTYASPGSEITLSTIDSDDILVTGPNGFSQSATLATYNVVAGTDGSQVTATYWIIPSGGTWTQSNAGVYTITMQPNQVGDSHDHFVDEGTLLVFNSTDIIAPKVTIEQTASQKDPTADTTINFTVVFSESVSDFTAEDVVLTGTAPGTLKATVTGTGTNYNVAVTGMTAPAPCCNCAGRSCP